MSAETRHEEERLIGDGQEDYGSTERGQDQSNIGDVVPWGKFFLGVFLVILAGCSFTAANVIQKIVCPSLNFWSLFLIRSLTQLAIMGTHLALTKTSILGPKASRVKIFLQGTFGGLLLLAIFVAVKHVPLGNASAIFFCTPVATFLLATFMLGEPLRCYRSLIIVFMLIGVCLITRPSWMGFPQDTDINDNVKTTTNVLGYVSAILVPILSGVVSIWTRQCRNVTASILMFWFGFGSLFWSLIGGAIFGQLGKVFALESAEIGWTFTIVALGMVGNLSYTFAVKWVSPTKANVFRSFEVILNYVLQIFLEHMIFHSTDVIGILFLLLAVLATGYESEVLARNLHHCL